MAGFDTHALAFGDTGASPCRPPEPGGPSDAYLSALDRKRMRSYLDQLSPFADMRIGWCAGSAALAQSRASNGPGLEEQWRSAVEK